MKNTPLMRLQARAQIFALCAAALLVGCGGGGGASAPPATSQTSPPPTPTDNVQVHSDDAPLSFPRALPHDNRRNFAAWEMQLHEKRAQNLLESREFKKSWHLERINAHKAYARGATGRGEIVGVVDTTLHLENHKFAGDGKVVVAFPLTTHGTKDPRFLTQSFSTHGTRVASVAVGARGGTSITNRVQGVAYDAKLAFADAFYGGVTESNAKLFNDHGAAIVNLSFGIGGDIAASPEEEIRRKHRDYATILAQADTDDADKIIYVWSAGNLDDKTSVEQYAGLGVYFPELRGHVLAVTGIHPLGVRSGSPCGIAKVFCLAAPAVDIWGRLHAGKRPQEGKASEKEGF